MDDHAKLKEFLSSQREWFFNWHSPIEATERLEEIISKLRSDFAFRKSAFVTHRDAKGLREMWVLAKCASLINIPYVKLCANDPPDGYVRRENDVIPAEVLEVLEPGRKRSLEVQSSPELMMDPGENWVRRANAIPGALQTGIESKKSKSYPDQTELFVYLNIDEYGIRQKEIEEQIHSTLSEPLGPFSAIHIRWKQKVYSDSGAFFFDRTLPTEPEFDDDSLWSEILSNKNE